MTSLAIVELAAQTQPWFGNPGLAGGLLGAAVGILGAIYGTVAGILVPQGKGKPLVFAIHWVGVTAGVGMLALGLTALILGQPYGVWFAFLLGGGIASAVFIPMTGMLRTRYRQAEQRRLEAEEFRQG